MIGKAELTQALALISATGMQAMQNPVGTFNRLNSYQSPRRGKYGRNLNRTCKLLRRIKTTC
jgi:hypothetical protein